MLRLSLLALDYINEFKQQNPLFWRRYTNQEYYKGVISCRHPNVHVCLYTIEQHAK